jgi:hypothetical protein
MVSCSRVKAMTTPALEAPIPAGQYPVVLTIAGGQVPAYATLWVRQSRPVRWDIARFDEGEKPVNDVAAEDDEIPGYPVDRASVVADEEG